MQIYSDERQPFSIDNLEVSWEYGGKRTGNQPIQPLVAQIPPKATTEVYRISGTWRSEFLGGRISVTVSINGGAKLIRSISW